MSDLSEALLSDVESIIVQWSIIDCTSSFCSASYKCVCKSINDKSTG